ncbi:MAG: DNA mismatch repair endonuclease MutL [Planctomycetota bacterium]|jgi:DNA mismatch repair protein MutL
MASIHVLPIHLVNKIAAGEVIERPASVVKELLENAIDAGATRIDVAIEDGGRKSMAVSDNGRGMGAEDLALAFAPHSTSKLAGEDDLFNIRTMGFRGEALASIASISHAHIRTRRSDDESGHEIEASGDTVGDPRPCAASPGTTITVRDLFFNTPARRKFMKTAGTEMGHITEQVTRLALPHPQVAFTLTHNGRTTTKLPPTESTLQRVRDVFGPDVADGLLPVTAHRDGLEVSGLAGPPSSTRASGKWQYVFLNGRYIRDRLLTHALREAYRGLIDPSRWPMAFLFIRIDPDRVDVNVHPTKIEVRFADSQQAHSAVLSALRDALNKATLAPTVQLTDEEASAFAAEPATDAPRQESLRDAMADFFKSAATPQPRLDFPAGEPRAAGSPARRRSSLAAPPAAFEPAQSPAAAAPVAAPSASLPGATGLPPAPDAQPMPAAAMQVHNAYLVAATDDGLIVVDQHALHERIIYNDLKQRLTQSSLTSQRMLIPQTLTVTADQAEALTESRELLERLGVVVEPFGPTTVAVQQFPALLAERGVDAGEFIRDALDSLTDDTTADGERLMESLLQMMACKASVKAGQPLTADEINDLLSRRDQLDKASSCPHGRPTTLKLTLRDLQKQFKRT